jgi:prophage regulatory protein
MSQGQTILRLPAAQARVGLRRTQIYERIRNGKFSPPIKLGSRASGWLVSEIDRWLEERGAQSMPATETAFRRHPEWTAA